MSRGWLGPALLAMAAASVSQGLVRFTYPFVLPAMTDDLLGGYGAAGLLGAANLGAYLLGVLVMTAGPRRWHDVRAVRAGLALCTLGLALVAVAPSVAVAAIGLAVGGFCSAAVWIPLPSLVAAGTPPPRRGVAYGLLTAGVGLAILGVGGVTSLLQRVFGEGAWRPVWVVAAGVGAVVSVVVTVGLRPARVPATVGQWPEATVRPSAAAAAGVVRLCVSYGLYGIGFSVYTGFLVAALQDGAGLSAPAATSAFALLGVCSVFGGVVVGRISDLVTRRTALAGAMLLTGGIALAVPLTRGAVAVATVAVYGLLMTGVGAVLAAYLGDALPPRDVGTAFGAATLAFGAGQFLAPPVGGWLADTTGSFTATYVAAAVCGIAGGAVALALPFRRPVSMSTVELGGAP